MDQSRSQMALWSIMAAPLFMSNDLRTLNSGAVTAINQDPLGIQGRRLIKEESGIEVFWHPLSNKASALVFFSKNTDIPYRYWTSLKVLEYTPGSYQVYDVFMEKAMPTLKDTTEFVVSINPSGVVMWHVTPLAE